MMMVMVLVIGMGFAVVYLGRDIEIASVQVEYAFVGRY